jgi:hypothetical protein
MEDDWVRDEQRSDWALKAWLCPSQNLRLVMLIAMHFTEGNAGLTR